MAFVIQKTHKLIKSVLADLLLNCTNYSSILFDLCKEYLEM